MSNMTNFRNFHLLKILQDFDKSTLPLDAFLNKYFRANKALGSKDRKTICESLYKMIRWKGLIDYFCKKRPITWEERIKVLSEVDLTQACLDPSIPPHVRVSFPKIFFDMLVAPFGEEKALDFCFTSNLIAPITVRANPLKTTRENLLASWEGKYPIAPCKESTLGIVFQERINFFELPEFKDGFFEVQDEGSQLVAAHVKPKPGDHVLDYCAGSGGKTLAFAHLMQEKGQIYLYDIRAHALAQARKRLNRAGIQNVQFLTKDALKQKGLLGRMDWILLDVPCSGSGTLRRNPDMKWRYYQGMIENLVEEQRAIFETALKYLAPGGHIVYATCSVFPEENQQQLTYFIKKHNLKLASLPFFTFPQKNGMDGFFAAVFKKAT